MSTELAQPGADPAVRGRTVIADRVVEKLAARAVSEVDQTSGATRRMLGLAVGHAPAASPPQVDVRLDGPVASIHVAMSVHWPAEIRQVTQQVRDRVTEQLRTLAGVRVAEVDIEITALVGSRAADPERVV